MFPSAVDHDEAERVGVDAREFRNVARDLAAIGHAAHLVGDFLDDGLEAAHWTLMRLN